MPNTKQSRTKIIREFRLAQCTEATAVPASHMDRAVVELMGPYDLRTTREARRVLHHVAEDYLTDIFTHAGHHCHSDGRQTITDADFYWGQKCATAVASSDQPPDFFEPTADTGPSTGPAGLGAAGT